MQVTVQPQEFEEVRVPAGMRVRIVATATGEIDIALLNPSQYDRFCVSDDGEKIDGLWHNEVDEAEFTADVPDAACWLIFWNAYEDEPVSVEYEITPV